MEHNAQWGSRQSVSPYAFEFIEMVELRLCASQMLPVYCSHFTDMYFDHADTSGIFIILRNQKTLQQSPLKLCNSRSHKCQPYISGKKMLCLVSIPMVLQKKYTPQKMLPNSQDSDVNPIPQTSMEHHPASAATT